MMNSVRFKKIDAFTGTNSNGNPAAVVFLDTLDSISDEKKLQIAKELKGFVSEVGYVARGTKADHDLCYYSSEREVAFCGHATIAIMNDLVANDTQIQSKSHITIATRTAVLQVENQYNADKSVFISAPLPQFSDKKVSAEKVAKALRCSIHAIDHSRQISIVNGGLETLIVPMAGLSEILGTTPDLAELNDFCVSIGVDIIILYSSEVSLSGSNYRTRVFAPTFGYLEDPATGSGNSALGYYLLANSMWDGEKLLIEQNNSASAPNFVKLTAKYTDDERRVWFGGGATLKISGEYCI